MPFHSSPPVFTATPYIANRQGGIVEWSIDGADETINSEVNIAVVPAGGWCTCREEAAEHYCINHRSIHMRTRDGEAPKCKPVPLHRVSRLAWIDIMRTKSISDPSRCRLIASKLQVSSLPAHNASSPIFTPPVQATPHLTVRAWFCCIDLHFLLITACPVLQ